MKKKLISVFLALVMVLSLLPSTALAADNSVPTEVNVPNTIKWSAPTIDGTTINQDTYKGKIQVLVGYNPHGTCSNSNRILSAIAGSDWIKRDNIQVIAVGVGNSESTDAILETIKTHKAQYAPVTPDNMVFTCSTNYSNGTFWAYHSLCGLGTTTTTFAFICIIDADNTVRYAWEAASGNQYFETYLDKIAGIEAPEADPTQSGSTTLPKLSKEEIAQLLVDNPLNLPANVFDAEPSVNAPYATGKVNEAALQAATDRLSALRRLAGLPEVKMDPALNAAAQYGAVLLAVSDFAHEPAQPADMEDSFYQEGKSATSSSNIFAGVNLTRAVDGFMDDSDGGNVSRLGHRRWQLNPDLGKVGFGYAYNASSQYRQYVDEKVFDRSGRGCNYTFIGWPASGNFPNNLTAFNGNTAWSVTLAPDKFQKPVQSALTVTLTRKSDNTTWTFSGSKSYTAATSGEYFSVNNDGYGVSNCIIFRPDGVSKYEGVYTVTITGLTDRSGAPTALSYEVDFFDSRAYQQAKPPAPVRYTVSFSAGGGSGSMRDQQVEAGRTFALPTCSFTAPAGKEFDHWEVGGRAYAPYDTITVNGNVTVRAVWKATSSPSTPSTPSTGFSFIFDFANMIFDVETGTATIYVQVLMDGLFVTSIPIVIHIG